MRRTVITANAVFSATVKSGWLKPTMPRPNSLSTMVSAALVRPLSTIGTPVVRFVAPNNARLSVRFAFVTRSSMIPMGKDLLPVSPSFHTSTPAVLV